MFIQLRHLFKDAIPSSYKYLIPTIFIIVTSSIGCSSIEPRNKQQLNSTNILAEAEYSEVLNFNQNFSNCLSKYHLPNLCFDYAQYILAELKDKKEPIGLAQWLRRKGLDLDASAVDSIDGVKTKVVQKQPTDSSEKKKVETKPKVKSTIKNIDRKEYFRPPPKPTKLEIDLK